MISHPKSMDIDSARVFLMTNSFETGGSERQFVTLAKSLSSAPFRLRIGCISRKGRFLDSLNDPKDIAEFPVGGNIYGFGSMQARWRLARYLRKQKIAIAHAFDFYTNLLLIPSARLAGVPVIIGSCRQLGDLLSPAKSSAELMVLRWCDRIVCNSNAAADRLRKKGLPDDKLVVIGNGLPPSFFVRNRPALPHSPSILRVGMVARMNTESKNHRSFLRLAASVCSRFPHTEFVLAGDGPLRDSLEQYASELGIKDKVLFVGDCSDTSALFASLDVSMSLSSSESLSNSILESMAAGVPVIASDVGGNRELLSNDRGMLVGPHDEEASFRALESLLKDANLRHELGKNAKRFVEANFSIENMRKGYEELYSELLTKKTRAQTNVRQSGTAQLPLRVAIIAASPRYVGGHSVQAELLAEMWRKDPEVSVSLIPIDPPLPRALGWVERVPFVRTLVREPFYIAALWRGLKHIDVAHIFSASYWSFLIAPTPAWAFARVRGCRTIIHYHSGEARDHLSRSRIARRILASADSLVVPSEYLVDVFQEFGLTARPVPNIVDLSQFTFRLRKAPRPQFLCTRGFHPYYAVDVVVRAFAEVKKEISSAELVLVGGGPQEAQIRRLVGQLKLDDVHFAGVVSRQQIARFYDTADIFVNASVLDNMPVSILEAFASGTPVVTTAPESMRYLVEHERTGMLSAPGDANGLARNMIHLCREPDFACYIANNAYRQVQQYDCKKIRTQWFAMYRSVTDASGYYATDAYGQKESVMDVVGDPASTATEISRN